MPHLQDSIHKSPVWGIMQHQCHTYKTRYTSRRCGGPCNTNATPTRLDTQVASVVEYKHQCHYIPSTNKSPVWRTMQHQCHYIPTPTRLDKPVTGGGAMQHYIHTPTRLTPVWEIMQHQSHTYKTRYTSCWCGGLCNTNATPTRLDTQVAGVGDYATPMPHLQDLSPVWGTMQHQFHTYKTRYTSRRCGVLCSTTQDSIYKSPV